MSHRALSSKKLRIARAKTGKCQLDAAGRLLIDVDPASFVEEIYEEFCTKNMCDGLPIIPPTEDKVTRMLRFTDRRAEDVILDEAAMPSGAPITVEKLAINAVMAGCKPEYFPIVITAFEGMADPSYRLAAACITLNPAATLVLVSGPIADEIGINSSTGCMGPGFRANATIGRAISMSLLNVCGSIPGVTDAATHGSPAKYTYCFAENRMQNPWKPINAELYDEKTTTVTVFKCQVPHNIMNDFRNAKPEDYLIQISSAASTIADMNAFFPGNLLVVLGPDHARAIAHEGWRKIDIQSFIFDKARIPMIFFESYRIGTVPRWPKWFRSAHDSIPVVEKPDDIMIVVAGGAGPESVVIKPWNSRPITRPLRLRDGTIVQSIRDFSQP